MSINTQDLVGAGADAWTAAMQSYASVWPHADLGNRPGYSVFWANSPFTLWNGLMLTDRRPQHTQLRETIEGARRLMQQKSQSGLLYVCHEFLPGFDLEKIMLEVGLEPKLRLRGMEQSNMPLIAPPSDTVLRFARLDTPEVAADFAAVISETYGYSREVCAAEFESRSYWREQAWAVVGYLGNEPVSTSSIIVSEGALYVGLVATRKAFRNRGYGCATNAHLLRQAADATGIRTAVLHATDAGFPVYERLGFVPTMTLTGFGKVSVDNAAAANIA